MLVGLIIKISYMVRLFSVFLIVGLIMTLVGCSSHAPSASMFMNSPKNSFILGVNGMVNLGNRYDYEIDDGSGDKINFEEYGPYAVEPSLECRGDNIFVSLSLELVGAMRVSLGLVSDYFGSLAWISPISFGYNKSPGYGLMLVEQYPFAENWKVGISEHFANNQYRGNVSLCLSCTSYAKDYKELGIGAYISYKKFSIEFRYGNELDSSNRRYYLMANYDWSFAW